MRQSTFAYNVKGGFLGSQRRPLATLKTVFRTPKDGSLHHRKAPMRTLSGRGATSGRHRTIIT